MIAIAVLALRSAASIPAAPLRYVPLNIADPRPAQFRLWLTERDALPYAGLLRNCGEVQGGACGGRDRDPAARLNVFRLLVQAGPDGMPAGSERERRGIALVRLTRVAPC